MFMTLREVGETGYCRSTTLSASTSAWARSRWNSSISCPDSHRWPRRARHPNGPEPATVTWILDRFEKEGWIRRERDTADLRKVLISAEPKRAPGLGRLFAGLLGRLSLEVLVRFLKQVRDAVDESRARAALCIPVCAWRH